MATFDPRTAGAGTWRILRHPVSTIILLVLVPLGWLLWARQVYPAEPKWGPVASWVAAVGTIGVLCLSAWTAIKAQRQLDRVRQEQQEERFSGQAGSVAWWLDLSAQDHPTRDPFWDAAFHGPPTVEGAEFTVVYLHVNNGSRTSLKNVSISCPRLGTPDDLGYLGTIPPGLNVFRLHMDNPPSNTGRFDARLLDSRLVDWVEFKDANNEVWRRDYDGNLEHLGDTPTLDAERVSH